MAQENTAVNALIARTQNKPLETSDEADDLFADPSKGARKASAAQPVQRPPSRATVQGHSLPPPYRKSGAMEAQGTPAPQILRPSKLHEDAQTRPFDQIEEGDHTPLPPPMVPQTEPIERTPLPSALKGIGRASQTGEEDSWFDKSVPIETETYVGPEDDLQPPARSQAIWWIGGAFALGLGLAALLFWPDKSGQGAKKDTKAPVAETAPVAAPTPTPAPVVAPAPVVTPAPVVAPAPAPVAVAAVEPVPEPVAVAAVEPTPAPVPEPVAEVVPLAPTSVSIRFDSVPSGAQVVLVEDGQTIPLGTAPVEREIDPAHHNEVMFTLEGHSSVILPVDANVANITARLGATSKPAPVAVAAVEPAPAPAPVVEKKVAVKTAPKHDVAPKARVAPPKPRVAAAEPAAGGDGVLMIASKPPCDIFVDGKNTGLTTPQRALSLPAGKHKIVLVNKEHDIKESFAVSIKASQSVRVIKDLTSKM